jgi:hypothetical protein
MNYSSLCDVFLEMTLAMIVSIAICSFLTRPRSIAIDGSGLR